jgi:hypothetical protein
MSVGVCAVSRVIDQVTRYEATLTVPLRRSSRRVPAMGERRQIA